MLITKKKYCCIATYRLSPDSILRRLCIKDAIFDEEGLIKLFENNNYKLLAKNDANGEIDAVIYKSDQEKISYHDIDYIEFEKEALKVIEKSLKCLHIAFLSIRNQPRYIAKKSDSQQISIDILDCETNIKAHCITGMAEMISSGRVLNNQFHNVFSQKIVTVLTVINCENNDKINEYIARFVSLENLSSDPVLHLLTVSSLYEYIKETSDNHLDLRFNEIKIGKIGKEKVGKKNFQDKELTFKDKFICTRNLAAHGLADEYTTVYNLEQILEIAPPETSTSGKRFYSFNRYNTSHINLINEVIGEAQPIIQQYLREELGLKQ